MVVPPASHPGHVPVAAEAVDLVVRRSGALVQPVAVLKIIVKATANHFQCPYARIDVTIGPAGD